MIGVMTPIMPRRNNGGHVPTQIIMLHEPLPLFAAPGGEVLTCVRVNESVRVYLAEKSGRFTQVEYEGKGAWAILPALL